MHELDLYGDLLSTINARYQYRLIWQQKPASQAADLASDAPLICPTSAHVAIAPLCHYDAVNGRPGLMFS
jgi:hypothetical protein